MATWVTHLIIADKVIERVPGLDKHSFCVGNIAPDCNIENEDWTQFTPSREITHWMSSDRKVASDCDRFYEAYIEKRRGEIHTVLSTMIDGMPENWDSVKKLIKANERMKDIYNIEAGYLEANPNSGYLTEIMGLQEFPDYLDYLPVGAIVRKIGVMGYLPKKEIGVYPFVAMTRDEYLTFLDNATEKVIKGIACRTPLLM